MELIDLRLRWLDLSANGQAMNEGIDEAMRDYIERIKALMPDMNDGQPGLRSVLSPRHLQKLPRCHGLGAQEALV